MKHKILILEDNTDFRNCIMEFLSENGIDALGAETIKEAMSILSSSFPSPRLGTKNSSEINLFLIDLKLPDGNGMNFLKAVRKESNTIPAIIMSIIITEDVRRIGKQLGVVAYFEKPLDLYELQEEVSRAIKTNMESRRSRLLQK